MKIDRSGIIIVILATMLCLLISSFAILPLGGITNYQQVVRITELDGGESLVKFWMTTREFTISDELIRESGMRSPNVFCSVKTEQVGIFGKQHVTDVICTDSNIE